MFLAASPRGESRKLLSGLTESEGRQYAKTVGKDCNYASVLKNKRNYIGLDC